jgi:hypothetical protein
MTVSTCAGFPERPAHPSGLECQILETARAAYARTRPGQREFGLGCLRRLLRWSLVPAPAMFLLAAYSPDWLTHARTRHKSARRAP